MSHSEYTIGLEAVHAPVGILLWLSFSGRHLHLSRLSDLMYLIHHIIFISTYHLLLYYLNIYIREGRFFQMGTSSWDQWWCFGWYAEVLLKVWSRELFCKACGCDLPNFTQSDIFMFSDVNNFLYNYAFHTLIISGNMLIILYPPLYLNHWNIREIVQIPCISNIWEKKSWSIFSKEFTQKLISTFQPINMFIFLFLYLILNCYFLTVRMN